MANNGQTRQTASQGRSFPTQHKGICVAHGLGLDASIRLVTNKNPLKALLRVMQIVYVAALQSQPDLLADERNYHGPLAKLQNVGPENDGGSTHAHGLRQRKGVE